MEDLTLNTDPVALDGKSHQTWLLEEVRLHPHISEVFQRYRKLVADGAIAKNTIRMNDYRRWSIVYSLLADGNDLLDIGVGAGQFANAAASFGRFKKVRGADYKEGPTLQRSEGWEFITYDLTVAPSDEMSADIVTCMECIEHIPNPKLTLAVKHLMQLARKRLIVTVPFLEDPMPSYHKQQFNITKLYGLFPGADVSLMATKNRVQWALVDWRP